jgi:hypothetical protein
MLWSTRRSGVTPPLRKAAARPKPIQFMTAKSLVREKTAATFGLLTRARKDLRIVMPDFERPGAKICRHAPHGNAIKPPAMGCGAPVVVGNVIGRFLSRRTAK